MRSSAHFRWPDVGIMGKAGAGKDTLAAELVKNLPYTRRALADALKEQVGALATGSTNAEKNRQWVEERKHTVSVRTTLQGYGQMMREHVHPEYWVDKVLQYRWSAPNSVGPLVTPDVRYQNEVAVFSREKWLLVRVVRPDYENSLTPEQRQHISEIDLDDYVADITLVNDGTPELLFDKFVGQASPIVLARLGLFEYRKNT